MRRERFQDIKISMNARKYQKLWVWLDSTHLFEYCWSLLYIFWFAVEKKTSVVCIYIFSHHAVCVNFSGTYSLTSTPTQRQIFEKLYHGRFIYSQSFYQKSAEGKFFFITSFWCLIWDTNPGFTSNKPTRNLLD